MMIQKAFKLEATVGPRGKVEIDVPLPPGTRVEVVVVAPEQEDFADLLRAAGSSTDFWDNPLDDEDWNNA
jgi:hypothetical protein